MILFTWELIQKIILWTIDGSAHGISQRIINNKGKDQKSHAFKHSCEKRCQHFRINNFEISGVMGLKKTNQIKKSLMSLNCLISQLCHGC